MNKTEKKMVEVLCDLRENHNAIGVKAEFEAEGTRLEEAMRLKEISLRAGMSLTIKIGGCEALKDMFDAAAIGCDYLVAPMIESPYALQKFVRATKIAFTEEQRNEIEFLFNVETHTAVLSLNQMLNVPETNDIDGVVIGRVDLCGSMGLSRESVNSKMILSLCKIISDAAKKRGLKVVIGGGISAHTIPFFMEFPITTISRFETRKVVFQCPKALANNKDSYLKAVKFEMLWLQNKKDYYGSIHREDDARLEMLTKRYGK